MSTLSEKEIAERQTKIMEAHEKHGYAKINLLRPGEGNEGVWVTPCDERSRKLMDDNYSVGEKVECYLMNMPLPWAGKIWGDKIVARTQGHHRPTASLEDNTT